MAASAKSRAALFQLSQIRTLPIRCELHQDQVLEASGQPRFSASIAFGSQHAHSGAAWFESGPQAEEASGHGSKRGTPRSDANQLIPPFASARQAAAGALLAQLHTMPRAAIHENADTALRTAMQLRHYEAVRAALGLEVVAPPVRAVLAQPPTPSSPRPSSCPSATLPSPPLLSSPSLLPFSMSRTCRGPPCHQAVELRLRGSRQLDGFTGPRPLRCIPEGAPSPRGRSPEIAPARGCSPGRRTRHGLCTCAYAGQGARVARAAGRGPGTA